MGLPRALASAVELEVALQRLVDDAGLEIVHRELMHSWDLWIAGTSVYYFQLKKKKKT